MRRLLLIFALLWAIPAWADTVTIRPSGLGSDAWTASAGNTWDCVDEVSANGDTDYVYRSESNATIRWTYVAPSVPAGSTSISVAVFFTGELVAGAMNVAPMIRVATTTYDDSVGIAMTGSYVENSASWAANPGSKAAWTPAEVNGTDATYPLNQFGVRSLGLGAGETVRVTQVYMVITYTPPGGRRSRAIIGGGFIR